MKMKAIRSYRTIFFLILSVTLIISNPLKSQTNSSALKAILIVGSSEDDNKSSIEEMNEIAEFLVSNKVIVHRFYDKKADWEKIKIAAINANFFVYSGHGGTLGENGSSGGLCINTLVNSEQIVSDLKLSEKCIVLFNSVCRGAGSSASDTGDIGLVEATKRVTDYAKPFFQIGVSAYYANNFTNGTLNFLKLFFSGKSLQESFESTTNGWNKIELLKQYEFDKLKLIGISSFESDTSMKVTTYSNGEETEEDIQIPKVYNIAFVGAPNFSIKDMYK
jgi:hypothetical protein